MKKKNYAYDNLTPFYTHHYTKFSPSLAPLVILLTKTTKLLQKIVNLLFYPREVNFYTDNVPASVTNSISAAIGQPTLRYPSHKS